MKIKSLDELFTDELFDILDAEQRLTEALPKMAEAATEKKLADGFRTHLAETKGQIERLEKVIKLIGIDRKKEKCEAMVGLIKEGEDFIKNIDEGPVLDAALITAAQKVEHYEIASYGTLVALAKTLGHDEAVGLLEESLEEEKATDEKLTALAEESVNEHALQEAA